ncbi:MAG: SAM-dependent DNA methyltransferase [Prevotella sp.]|nr:SAM-dependent DNA methyltransferase [Candidatus Equicola stercoris]
MITSENKNQVDKIWNIFFSNGINNPLSVVEQFTYLLFIKMLDDKEIEKESLANSFGISVLNPTFPDGFFVEPDHERGRAGVRYHDLRWHVFREMGAENMFRIVRDYVFDFIKQIGDDESAYTRYINDARLEISYPDILQSIVQGIDNLNIEGDYNHVMGDIYEYILDTMAANGASGQFRTPPHIIRMMVEMMQPTVDDIICDPAMGTAGFLVESAKYLQEKFSEPLMDEETQARFNSTMFNGFDTDPTMMRIGSMHLMVNNVKNPSITRRDSLSQNNNDEKLYTLTLANPPFAGSVNASSINAALKQITDTRKTELLFVAQFLRGLRLGGRCASIVPDGVLFGTSKAHVSLRKELVENQYLRAVISMPSGVFKPYAGVSTAILIFTRTDNGGTDRVWFYDMTADGYTLDDRRTPTGETDIPDIVNRFLHMEGEEGRTRKDKSFLVPVDEIRSNGYDLSINKYKEIERVKVEYEPVSVLLSRLGNTEKEFAKGYEQLTKMLEEDA